MMEELYEYYGNIQDSFISYFIVDRSCWYEFLFFANAIKETELERRFV